MKREVLFVCICIALFTDSAAARVWTDASGQYQVRANFVSADQKRVKLQREDGSLVAVELSRLSEADRKHVQLLQQPLRPARKSLMDEPISFKFDSCPLRQAMEQIAAEQRVPMWIALPRSIDPETPVTGEADNTPLGQALHSLLAPLRADAQVKHEALVVDVKELVTIFPELRVYALPPGTSGQELARKIEMIDRRTWREFGMPCDTVVWENPPAILVTQSHLNHAIIRRRFPALKLVEGTVTPKETADPVELALQKRITVKFKGRLDELFVELEEQTGVPVEFDPALEEGNFMFPSRPTTMSAEGITLESALNLLAQTLTIEWQYSPSIRITHTRTVAKNLPERWHDLRGLSFNAKTLESAAAMIDPESWDETGTRGHGQVRVEGDRLFVKNTMANQQHIAQMLADLRELSTQSLLAEK